MKCVFCKSAIEEGTYYAEMDVLDASGMHYLTVNCCAKCASKFIRKTPDEFVVNLHCTKKHKGIAKEPMRKQYGQWIFARSQVENISYKK